MVKGGGMQKVAALFFLALAGFGLYAMSSAMTAVVSPFGSPTQTPANSSVAATVQIGQYMQAAEATATLRQATLEADYRNVAATAQAAAVTAVWAATTEAEDRMATQAAATATIEYQRTRDAMEMSMTQDSATARAIVAANIATSTAEAQATANSFSATRQAIQLTQEAATARREQTMAIVAAVVGVATVIIVIALVALFFWRVMPTLVNRAGIVRYGQHKNPLFLTERGGRLVMSDPLAMLQAAMTINKDGDVDMPDLSPNELQFLLAGGRMRVLMEQIRNAPGHQPQLPSEVTTQKRLSGWESYKTVRNDYSAISQTPTDLQLSPPAMPSLDGNEDGLMLPDAISWQWLAQYSGDGLAIGAGHGNRIVAVDLAKTPHLFSAGMSGSGKTRRFLRPLVAQALAAGFYAVLMNESGSDFMPFYEHSNVAIVRGDASTYMNIFSMAIDEMSQREQVLRQHRVSEWRRLPATVMRERPLMLLAIDELLALAMLLTPAEQKKFWGLLAAFASRARKVGMSSVALATDPTYRALGQGGLNYRSQCGRLSFRMMQSSGSRAILDESGAETLGDGAFMALLNQPGVVHGMAANPTDDELRSYLHQQPATRLQQPVWLPATTGHNQTTTSVQPLTTSHNHQQPPQPVATSTTAQQPRFQPQPQPVVASLPLDATRPPTDFERDFIRQMYGEMQSKNAVCKHAYGFKDGKTYGWVSAAIDQ